MSSDILVIEDEEILAKNIQRTLQSHGCETEVASNGEEGLEKFSKFKPDLVLLDFNLPDMNGLEILSSIRNQDAQVKVILITAHGNVQLAVDAMKAGAYDYLSKPVVLSELKMIVDKAIGQNKLEGALSYYRQKQEIKSGLSKFIGSSPAVMRLKQQIMQLLEAEKSIPDSALPPVLITGETGTGKELVARALHFDGARRGSPFVEVNSASIPSQLFESELFGYERGAFTDARQSKPGLVESANGGTLFLDEIGDSDLTIQAKLLKMLEDKTTRRLGSTKERSVDVRIIAATNQDLEGLIRDCKFREDLYYRLHVVGIHLPPLRERGKDIIALTEMFLKQHARRYGKTRLQLSDNARDAIQHHSWPGNVRQLRNVMEQAVLLCTGDVIEPEDLSIKSQYIPTKTVDRKDANGDVAPSASKNVKLAHVERDHIVKLLGDNNGNITRTANVLGISRDQLRYRIRKYNVPHNPYGTSRPTEQTQPTEPVAETLDQKP